MPLTPQQILMSVVGANMAKANAQLVTSLKDYPPVRIVSMTCAYNQISGHVMLSAVVETV